MIATVVLAVVAIVLFIVQEPLRLIWPNLHYATWRGDDAGIEIALRRDGSAAAIGATVSAPFNQFIVDWTALHIAAYRQHETAVASLLDHGADPNQVDAAGRTPLALCVLSTYGTSSSRIRIAELLVRSGSNPTMPIDSNGTTALHLAAYRSDASLLAILAQHAADADVPDDYGETPLLAYLRSSRPSLAGLELLLRAGLGVDADAERWATEHRHSQNASLSEIARRIIGR